MPHNAPLAEIDDAARSHWKHAADLRRDIDANLAKPPTAELRLVRLRELFDLEPLERDILLLCLLPELDPRYRRLYGYLQDDCSKMHPRAELIFHILRSLVSDPQVGWSLLNPDSHLIASQLLV